MRGISVLLLDLVSWLLVTHADAVILPEVLQDTQWIDNFKGSVHFSTWQMSGWDILAGEKTISHWHIVDTVQFQEEGYLAFIANETFDITDAGTTDTYYSYLCLKFQKINEIIYKYQIHHEAEARASNEKVLLSTNFHLTRLDDICDPAFDAPDGEYGVLVKKDVMPVNQCPNAILGRFQYDITLPDGTSRCVSNSVWDGCEDSSHLLFNVTKCTYPVAFSAGGDLTCVASAEVGDVTYITVYNTDETVDETTTHRFSCLVAKDDGLTVSIAPHGCQPGQLPNQIPTDLFGNQVGYTIVNTKLGIHNVTGGLGLMDTSLYVAVTGELGLMDTSLYVAVTGELGLMDTSIYVAVTGKLGLIRSFSQLQDWRGGRGGRGDRGGQSQPGDVRRHRFRCFKQRRQLHLLPVEGMTFHADLTMMKIKDLLRTKVGKFKDHICVFF